MLRPDQLAGLTFSQSIDVDESLTAPSVSPRFGGFAEMRPVFATAFRWGSLRGEHTVGTHIDVSHVAPTPIGPHVKADVELLAVEGRKLRFRVWCFDALERIGEGTHERAIIRMASFLRRVEAKHLVAGKSG